MAMPLNEMPSRLDQMRDEAVDPMMSGPMPPAPMPPAAEPAADDRMGELLAALGGEGEMMPPEPAMEESPMVIGSALAQAAVENTGSVAEARASLEAALAELDTISA
tara:strand:- start:833 stop:1153 length:321 start_codon:yes stop_codon:yes gene_type:complete